MKVEALYHRTESEYAFLNRPDEFVVLLRTAKNDVAKVTLYYGDPFEQRQVNGQTIWPYETSALKPTLQTQTHQYWRVKIRLDYKRLQYAFLVEGQDQSRVMYGEMGALPFSEATIQNTGNYFRLSYFHPIDQVKPLPWVQKTIWYQIFPERFANGNRQNDPDNVAPWDSNSRPARQSYYGGDLQGIIDHLDDLVALGVNGLYLTPIFKAHTNHKYDTVDYFEIDPEFGDKQTLKTLIDAAHERQMKVMLDAVFNHIGDRSDQWQDVLRYQAKSRFKDWFYIHGFPVGYQATADDEVGRSLTYETFAHNPHMPKLNTTNPEVAQYLLGVAQYWIQQFDIDAWRLDVADEVPHEFWRQFAQKCRQLKPDFYILGEVWHDAAPWLTGSEFSGVMNYRLMDLIQAKFLKHTMTNTAFIYQINQNLLAYRETTTPMCLNLLGSHDTPRVKTVAQHDTQAVRAAFAFLFLQKGTPCIYYGDEIGMVGGPDPDNRRPMLWHSAEQDLEMLTFMKILIQFRKDYADFLNQATLTWLEPTDPELLTFQNTGPRFDLKAIFNLGSTVKKLTVTHQETILLQQNITYTQHILSLEPNGFLVIRRDRLNN